NVAPQASPPPSSGMPLSTPFPAIPASVRIPIIVGPVPAPPSGTSSPPKPIVLHENTLILNPEIFSHLTPQHVHDLEALGAQKALEILQAYIVRYYKEKLKADGARGRGRGRPRRGRGMPLGRGSTPAGASTRSETPASGPFTTAPLPPRLPKLEPTETLPSRDAYSSSMPPASASQPQAPVDAPSPIVVVDDDDPSEQSEEPVAKRRRLDGPGPAVDAMAT
ncbi:hypothetical protein K466DRAFT_600292, partial [Polyporus arcularius HHB13444]